jgi:hypothetical protein
MTESPKGRGFAARKALAPAGLLTAAVLIALASRQPPPATGPGVGGGRVSPARGSVTMRGYDLARTGWNRNEDTLAPGNVTPSTFHKIGELRVDAKIEASPLYVAGVATDAGARDLLVVAASNNDIHVFDAATNAELWSRSLGTAVDRLAAKGAPYPWGITATPVIDPDTQIVYIVRVALEGGNKVYRLFGLRLVDGSEAIVSQAVDGRSVKRSDTKFFRNDQQLIRTALALWRGPAGDKAVIFGAAGGEDANGASGWVIAYNLARLSAGGAAPAVWCSTPTAGGAGVWMASQGVAVDESDPRRDIYLATGNGPYQQELGADDLGESVVRLRYDPAANTLETVDWFTPFKDADHDPDHRDQDLGAAGVLVIPGARSVLAGGKEGIFYNVDRDHMGKLSHASLLQPDFVATFTPAAGFDYLADTNQATTTDGVTGSNGDDRTFIPHPADGGRTRHVHGGPIYFENGRQRLVYVMGENSALRAYAYDGTRLTTTPIAQSGPGTAASGAIPPPGGMPGGFLSASSADGAGTNGVVWSLAPRRSLWRDPVAGGFPGRSVLRAFAAAPSAGGVLTELWNSELDLGDAVGRASKFQPPLVAGGKVYVATYDNRVVVYGTTPSRQTARDVRRTMILIKSHTQPGQDLFIRGGIDHAYGNAHGRNCPTTSTPPFDDPRRYNCAVRIEHRNTLNYGTSHEPYPVTNRWQVNDNYLDWYGREEFQEYQRIDARGVPQGQAPGTPLDWTTDDTANPAAVVRTGYGFLKENRDAGLGDDHWMLDVDMDCESAVTIDGVAWFELRGYLTNVPDGREPDVVQADRPYASPNHFGRCGEINVFEWGRGSVAYRDFDAVNQCSIVDVERRCDGGRAQVCRSVGGARVWRDDQDCVQARRLCQVSTGRCCTPTNGPGSNRNCF